MNIKPKPIYIEWLDAVADVGWEISILSEDVCECKTMGFLIKETKTSYIVASTISGDQSNARIAIPKKWVKKKRLIKLP